MKAKKVRKEIKQLINKHGSPAALSIVLRISPRYVEMMRDGRKPGKRLYHDIINLSEREAK